MKIAVLGGSFDPVHAGHLQIAKEALKMGMDEVWLMPTHDTPLKSRALSEDAHRVAMLKRAAAPYRRIRVCTMELERPGVSYTVDTARALIARYPDDTFFWLIGSDQALQLPRWKDIDELLQLVQIVVFSREDTSVPRSPYPLIYRPMQLVPISSTQLREGNGWRYLHPAVKGYISAHRLYLESFVKGHMSSRRYAHSVRVAQLSAQLAHAHHLDEGAAWEAGMLHDLCKEMPKAQMEIWIRQLFPQHLDEPAAIWHGYLGSVFASRLYGCQDKRVRCAIYHHVKGDCTQPYAMITYCADKLEPGRGYDSREQIALCMRSLRRGFMRVKAEQSEYLKKEKNGQ